MSKDGWMKKCLEVDPNCTFKESTEKGFEGHMKCNDRRGKLMGLWRGENKSSVWDTNDHRKYRLSDISGKVIEKDCLASIILHAHNYTVSHAHNRHVLMKVHTEEEPIQYSFGYYADSVVRGAMAWHEACRIHES